MAEGSGADGAAASFDAMFTGVSLQSLLLGHSLHHPFFSNHCDDDSAFPIVDNSVATALKLPKPEPLDISDEPLPLLLQSAHPSSEPIRNPHFPLKNGTQTAAAARRRAAASRNNQRAREQRRRISEKMKFLKKLMPWNRKMDTATMLEEAYKYILYLEAQVSALYSMPVNHAYDPPPLQHYHPATDYSYAESSGILNRQQTMQVLVNSPLAQTVFYSRGQCLVTAEQLGLAEEAMRATYRQQQQTMMMLFDSSSSSVPNFF